MSNTKCGQQTGLLVTSYSQTNTMILVNQPNPHICLRATFLQTPTLYSYTSFLHILCISKTKFVFSLIHSRHLLMSPLWPQSYDLIKSVNSRPYIQHSDTKSLPLPLTTKQHYINNFVIFSHLLIGSLLLCLFQLESNNSAWSRFTNLLQTSFNITTITSVNCPVNRPYNIYPHSKLLPLTHTKRFYLHLLYWQIQKSFIFVNFIFFLFCLTSSIVFFSSPMLP